MAIRAEIRNKHHVEYEELTNELGVVFETEKIEKEETDEYKLVTEIVLDFPPGLKTEKEMLRFAWDAKTAIYKLLKQVYGME
jgi:hypothetical protein